MKAEFVFLSFFLAFHFVQATDRNNSTHYHQGAVWSYYQYEWDQYTFFRYTLDGDTTIGARTYQKMYAFSTCTYQREGAQYVGALREEAGKVYCQLVDAWWLPIVEGEVLVYDFSLQVGDSVVQYGETVAYVISVDSVTVGERTCKRLKFGRRKTDVGVFDCWLEGLGSTMRSFFKPLYPIPTCPCGDVLNVYNNADGVTVYTNPLTDALGFLAEDCLYNGLTTMKRPNGLILYPNPVAERLHIACVTSLAVIDVLDMEGRVLWTASSNEVDVSGLSEGVYTIRAVTESGQSLNARFVKRVR